MSASSLFHLRQISRREFLKLAGASLLTLLCPPLVRAVAAPSTMDARPGLGRILANRVLVYTRPSLDAKVVKALPFDQVLPITEVTLGDEQPDYNRIWYQLNGEGYVHSGSVQPVEIRSNTPVRSVPEKGQLAEVTVPYTDVLWSLRKGAIAYRFYYSTLHWVTAVRRDEQDNPWYEILDDKWGFSYYGNPAHFRLLQSDDLAPLSPQVPVNDKRLEIRLAEQVVVAYEGDQPVYITRAATGAQFSDGDYRTPRGHYITNRKRPSRHMAAGDRAAPNSYDLPGVPWVSYLTKSGISFHGTFWHNDYGRPRSHGCINLSPEAARWVYLWSLPTVPTAQHWWDEENGTDVQVI